ncbi:TolC family protein [bacterium]|nr:TolC family protein [bacterium]
MSKNITETGIRALVIFILVMLMRVKGEGFEGFSSGDSTLSLEDCIQRALEYSPSIESKIFDLESSEARKRGEYSSFMPKVTTGLGWRRYDKEMLSITADEIVRSSDSYSASLSATQSLFTGGYQWFSMKYQQESYRQEVLSLKQEKSDIVYAVKSTYYAIIAAQRLVILSKLGVKRAEDQLNLVTQKYELGSASQSDVAKTRVLMAEEKLRLIQAQNGEREYREDLNELLNYPLDLQFTLASDSLISRELKPMTDYIELALDSSLDISSMENALNLYKIAKTMVNSAFYPALSLSLNYSWNNIELPDNWEEWRDADSWTLSMNLSWTLFNGLSRYYDHRESSLNFYKGELQLDQTIKNIVKQVRQTYGKVMESQQRIELSEARLEDARLTYEITSEKYKLGTATLLELLDSEVSLTSSENEHIQALYEYKINIALLDKLCGEIR